MIYGCKYGLRFDGKLSGFVVVYVKVMFELCWIVIDLKKWLIFWGWEGFFSLVV